MTVIHFNTEEFAQAAGEFIYVNPLFLTRYEDNPLKLPALPADI